MTKSPPMQNKIHEAVLEAPTDLHRFGVMSDARMLKFKTLYSEIAKESNTHLGKKQLLLRTNFRLLQERSLTSSFDRVIGGDRNDRKLLPLKRTVLHRQWLSPVTSK